MGVTRFGQRSLPALLTGGIFRGDQAQEFHQFSWGIKPCQVTHCCYQGYGYRALHATQGLQSLDHRVQPPGLHVRVEFLFEPLEACGMLMNRSDYS